MKEIMIAFLVSWAVLNTVLFQPIDGNLELILIALQWFFTGGAVREICTLDAAAPEPSNASEDGRP